MKTTIRLLTALLVIGLLGTVSLAESDGPGEGEGVRRRNREEKKKCGSGKMDNEKFYDGVNATPEQRKQLKQICDTHKQAMKNWRQENGEKLSNARKALKEAKKGGDKEAVKAAKVQLKEIKKSRKALGENFKKQLSEVLSKEQMEKMKKMRRRRGPDGHHRHPGMGKGRYGKLNLTDEQKAKIKKLHKEAAEKGKSAKTREEKAEIRRNLRKKINEDVLTKEQRDKAAKHFKEKRKAHRDKFLKGIDATDAQKAQIDKIMQAARKEAEGKSPEERRDIMKAAHKKVNADVLTDEQRAKSKKMRESRKKGKKGKRKCGPGKCGPRKDGKPEGGDRKDS